MVIGRDAQMIAKRLIWLPACVPYSVVVSMSNRQGNLLRDTMGSR